MPKTNPKPQPDLVSAEREHQFSMGVLSVIQLLIAKGSPVAITFIICAAVVLTARELAGKTTLADVAFRAIADFKGLRELAVISSASVGGGGVLYGLSQRKLRLDVEKRNKKKRATQMSFDPSKFLGNSEE